MIRVRHTCALPAAVLSAVLAFPSCSAILEDRRECPGWLVFDLKEDCGLSGKDQASLFVFEGDSTVVRENAVPLEAFTPEGYSVAVPRGHVDAAGVVGCRRAAVQGQRLSVSSGEDYDPVYLFRGDAVTGEEDASMPVSLHKEHSVLEVSFAPVGNTDEYPYRIRVRGSSCGVDLVTGEPIDGKYDCYPEEPESGVFRCILPRQTQPRNLRLDLYDRSSEEGDGFVESVALQPYITRLRDFSWDDPDLKDIRIKFDFATSQVTITLGEWQDGCMVSLRI